MTRIPKTNFSNQLPQSQLYSRNTESISTFGVCCPQVMERSEPMQLAALPKGSSMATACSIPEGQPTKGAHLYRKSSGAIVLHSTLNHLQVGTAGVLSAHEGEAAALLGSSLNILV